MLTTSTVCPAKTPGNGPKCAKKHTHTHTVSVQNCWATDNRNDDELERTSLIFIAVSMLWNRNSGQFLHLVCESHWNGVIIVGCFFFSEWRIRDDNLEERWMYLLKDNRVWWLEMVSGNVSVLKLESCDDVVVVTSLKLQLQ